MGASTRKVTLISAPSTQQETPRARQAYVDFLAMGPQRSLRDLCASYLERQAKDPKAQIPTTSVGTLQFWSSQFHWRNRIDAYDLKLAERQIELHADRTLQLRAKWAKLVEEEMEKLHDELVAGQAKVGTIADRQAAMLTLDKGIRLACSLLGSPLTDSRTELTGKGGEPIRADLRCLFRGTIDDLLTGLDALGAGSFEGEPDSYSAEGVRGGQKTLPASASDDSASD